MTTMSTRSKKIKESNINLNRDENAEILIENANIEANLEILTNDNISRVNSPDRLSVRSGRSAATSHMSSRHSHYSHRSNISYKESLEYNLKLRENEMRTKENDMRAK